MALNKNILKEKIKILDAEIKALKYRLNAMEWKRKKYLQFCDKNPNNMTSHPST